ncbi:hypothetical protein AB205_0200480 [Aquarana catesbeiana]|uniref:Uncharacterized protein n=1 Tax=Aquarana catesbeiana TaxID=8400 RepID=A0A2G9Q5M7_AQUCT|nr:hypothetical protein AB205_0200480 [Aquarana catesbeiana]
MYYEEYKELPYDTSLYFWGPSFYIFLAILKAKFGRCTQCVNMCYLPLGISMYTFCGCNPFLVTQVGERKGLHPQNTSIDPP